MHYLGIYAREQGLKGSGQWWHFGADDNLLRYYEPHAHIPIRHPLSVAKSWAQRDKTGQPLERMLEQYRCMFEYLEDHEATFHRIEGLPRLAGIDDHQGAPEQSSKITQYQSAVIEHVIEPHRDFFATFYPDLQMEA